MKGQMIEYSDLQPGMLIRVAFGNHGSQKAIVDKVTRDGNVHVKKWRASSARWTKPVRLYPQEFLGYIGRPDQAK